MLYNDDKNLDSVASSIDSPTADLSSMRGQLITFEGIDGSGKSTLAMMAADWLRARKIPVLSLREPGGTAIGESIRTILLAKANTAMCMETELMLFAAARAQLIREIIKPALAAGTWVICDRFYDSTFAYQGYGRGLDLDHISHLMAIATGGLKPDRTFLLDVSLDVAVSRLNNRPGKADRLDQEDAEFMKRTRDGYLAILAAEPDRLVRIDADLAENDVLNQITKCF
ncbi:MAG: dTMP kinase [Eubacteriales bacterium]|nr:dTMP kinase [Eubacteriales bacterium]